MHHHHAQANYHFGWPIPYCYPPSPYNYYLQPSPCYYPQPLCGCHPYSTPVQPYLNHPSPFITPVSPSPVPQPIVKPPTDRCGLQSPIPVPVPPPTPPPRTCATLCPEGECVLDVNPTIPLFSVTYTNLSPTHPVTVVLYAAGTSPKIPITIPPGVVVTKTYEGGYVWKIFFKNETSDASVEISVTQ
ncbi:MAG: hypothetical protein AAGA60_13720 [Cyanobacteria bacterium P01_E01_bin.42]